MQMKTTYFDMNPNMYADAEDLQEFWAVYVYTNDLRSKQDLRIREQIRQEFTRQIALNFPGDYVVRVYVDVAGGSAFNRPEYQTMLRDARAGDFSYVLVSHFHELGRDLVDAVFAAFALEDSGVAVGWVHNPTVYTVPVDRFPLFAGEVDETKTAMPSQIDIDALAEFLNVIRHYRATGKSREEWCEDVRPWYRAYRRRYA